MAYLDDLLGRDEQVLVYGRQHGIVILFQVIGRVISLLVLATILLGIQSPTFVQWLRRVQEARRIDVADLLFSLSRYIQIGCLFLMALVLLGALIDYLRWNARNYVLTNRRIIHTEGVINKRSIDSSLEKINDVRLDQSWLGRMLNYGDLVILTASEQGYNALSAMIDPLDFKRSMQAARHKLAERRAAGAQPARSNISQALESLVHLRDQNLLTPEEFEAKKQDLLRRL